ncbi:hypothetical protein T484DRAFT_1762968, partial [Baffinella frigidus]
VLTMSNNQLKEIPLEIGNCLKLKTLEVKNNPALTVPPAYIGPTKTAEYLMKFGEARKGDRRLDLSNRKLTGFPPEVTWVGKILRVLDLSNNTSVGAIPYSICELSALTALAADNRSFVGNTVWAVPLPVCLHRVLRVIDLSNNTSVGAIPYSICELSALTALAADDRLGVSKP